LCFTFRGGDVNVLKEDPLPKNQFLQSLHGEGAYGEAAGAGAGNNR
jgi:hypothetical protein